MKLLCLEKEASRGLEARIALMGLCPTPIRGCSKGPHLLSSAASQSSTYQIMANQRGARPNGPLSPAALRGSALSGLLCSAAFRPRTWGHRPDTPRAEGHTDRDTANVLRDDKATHRPSAQTSQVTAQEAWCLSLADFTGRSV
ncbi:hypothetical protein P7K49_018585 [Saguinus oedipus]|uniref:Uncharacterized protein n=1 Tax=Saguinus oedipus TaxID=9490 RepID=A0ABQ9V5T3_SAGOE|nr:hypothetical protein P7K49_018585 [Saguinus oedipus]